MAGEEISIVSKIGGSLLEGAAGNLGGLALGQLLSITGIVQDETAQKLDEILTKLNAIENEIKSLAQMMSVEISELQFDLAVQPAQVLMNANGGRAFRSARRALGRRQKRTIAEAPDLRDLRGMRAIDMQGSEPFSPAGHPSWQCHPDRHPSLHGLSNRYVLSVEF